MNIAAKLIPNRPSSILVGRIVSSALSLVNAPLIARALGPDGRGETAAAIAAFFLIPIVLSIGLPLEVRRLAAIGNAASIARSARWVALSSFPFACGLGVTVNLVFFQTMADLEQVILIVGISMAPFMVSWMCDEGVLLSGERFRSVALLQLTQPAVNTLSIVIGALVGQLTVVWVMISYLVGLLFTAVAGWLLAGISWSGPRYSVTKLLRGSLSFAGSSVSEAMANRIDQVVILPLIGSFQAGLYAVAVTIGTIPIGLAHALGASEFRSIADSSPDTRNQAQQRAVRSALAIGVLFCLALAAGTPLAVSILFGERFSAAVFPVWILLIGAVFMIGSYVASTALVAGNSGFRMTAAQTVGASTGVIALFLLGPSFGALGAAIAASIGYATTFFFLLSSIGGPFLSFFPGPKDCVRAVQNLVGHRILDNRETTP